MIYIYVAKVQEIRIFPREVGYSPWRVSHIDFVSCNDIQKCWYVGHFCGLRRLLLQLSLATHLCNSIGFNNLYVFISGVEVWLKSGTYRSPPDKSPTI